MSGARQLTRLELALAARELIEERVLSKGGIRPDPKVIRAACFYFANKALKVQAQRLRESSATSDERSA